MTDKRDFVVRGFAVDSGVNPVQIMNARKDARFQAWLHRFDWLKGY